MLEGAWCRLIGVGASDAKDIELSSVAWRAGWGWGVVGLVGLVSLVRKAKPPYDRSGDT